MASVPVPTPTACGTWLAMANSRSNASTSGPSTNQPLAITRSIAVLMSAASSPGVSALKGTFTDVLQQVAAVIVEGPLEAFAQFHGRRPAGALLEEGRVGIEAADVDHFLVGRPFDERVAARARDVDEHLDEIAMRDVLFAADVERLAVDGIARARRQERFDRVIDVDKIADLRAVAEHLDLAILERETNEPANEALAIVSQQLARSVDVREAQRARADAEHVVVDEMVVLAGRLVDA